jgi:hypothetical protein
MARARPGSSICGPDPNVKEDTGVLNVSRLLNRQVGLTEEEIAA